MSRQKKAGKMNVWLRGFILGVFTSLTAAKSLPYGSSGVCKDTRTEFLYNKLCCSKCRPGTRLVSYCTSETDTQCEPCDAGMYSEVYNYYPNCFSCATCPEERGLMYTKQCSSEGNAECECKPGWYCVSPEEPCTACEQHRKCGPGKGAVSPGTSTENVKCRPCPEGTYSNETSSQPCQPHTRCELQNRSVKIPGTATSDTVCEPRPKSPTPIRHTTALHIPVSKATTSPSEPSTKPPILDTQPTSESTISAVITPSSSDIKLIGSWIGLTAAAALVVLLIVGFCIYHRKALDKPAVPSGVEAEPCCISTNTSSPAENQGLLGESSTDPSLSSSSDSHSQGTGVSHDCFTADQVPVSSPILNVSFTATINCQVNPAMGSCSIPISPCVQLSEPEFPLSQEEELCKSCEQEDSKDAIQSVQESGMTKY